MVIILMRVGKNIMEDVSLNEGSNVNIIIEDLTRNLRLPIPKPTPYTLRMANQTLTKPIGLI
jgi:hypothetical protein